MNEVKEISWVDIFVTEKCNMKCKYCFHTQKPRDMEDKMLEKAIDFLSDKLTPSVVFNFFGGEPLMRPEFCIEWIDKLKIRFPKCRFHISTNGLLVDESIARMFRTEGYIFQVSYDALNQEELRGWSVVVENNIKRYLKILGSENLNIRLTYTEETVADLLDNVKYIYDMGIRKIMHHACLSNGWKDYHFTEYNKQLDKIYEFIDEHEDLHMTFCDYSKVANGKENAICGAGKNVVAVDAGGDIFPCHRMVNFPELKIGNVLEERLNRGRFVHIKIPQCEACEAKATCHPCIAANYEFNGSFLEVMSATCEINKYEYKKAKDKYIKLKGPIPDEESLLEKMVTVLTDMRQTNNDIIEEMRNEKFINKSSSV